MKEKRKQDNLVAVLEVETSEDTEDRLLKIFEFLLGEGDA